MFRFHQVLKVYPLEQLELRGISLSIASSEFVFIDGGERAVRLTPSPRLVSCGVNESALPVVRAFATL